MALFFVALIFIAFDVLVWLWGVDSRDWGRDPRTDNRPTRSI